MRLFVALNLPKKQKRRIERAARPLREEGYPFRWVDPELYHVTLKFLGDAKRGRVEEISDALDRVSDKNEAFDVEMGEFGAFPSLRRPNVLWLGVEASPALRCLKQDLEWELSERGFEKETRSFHPHLTIGRTKKGAAAGRFRGLDEQASELDFDDELRVWKLDLMRSQLSSSGPTYTVLESARLRQE